ncbi:hypothetical protein AB3N60_19325 (plasmid) [Leptospira sp. WS39.C2]
MEFQNKTEYEIEFSERIRTYLLLNGIQNEFSIANTITNFLSLNQISHNWEKDWSMWIQYTFKTDLMQNHKLPFPDRSWQFGSMVPKESEWKRESKKSRDSLISSFKPFFIIASIFIWSALYYLIIFRLL